MAMQYHLRPEARPLSLESLHSSQADAFWQIVSAVEQAAESTGDAAQVAPESDDERPDAETDRNSRVLFLSGERGTGKTSLLLTVRNEVVLPATEGSKDTEKKSSRADNETSLNCLRKTRLIWLEPLDMDPLPRSTNLLAAILARIDQAMRWDRPEGECPRGLLNPLVGGEEALMELQRLKADVSLAWDGNIEQRAGQLDPDAYAQEVIRTEHARLRLNRRLRRVLDKLAKLDYCRNNCRQVLFVLPVDDVDLNPARCVDLLRLLRLISVPRLFVIALGDVHVAETVFALHTAGRLAELGTPPPTCEFFAQAELPPMIQNIAFEALRKLVPPTQRCRLRYLTANEALRFHPPGSRPRSDQGEAGSGDVASAFRLSELLEKCTFEPQDHKERGRVDKLPIENLYHLMCPGDFPLLQSAPAADNTAASQQSTPSAGQEPADGSADVHSNPVKTTGKGGRGSTSLLLVGPARRALDMWLSLSRLVELKERFDKLKKRLEEQKKRLEEQKKRLEEQKKRLEEQKKRLEEQKISSKFEALSKNWNTKVARELIGWLHDALGADTNLPTPIIQHFADAIRVDPDGTVSFDNTAIDVRCRNRWFDDIVLPLWTGNAGEYPTLQLRRHFGFDVLPRREAWQKRLREERALPGLSDYSRASLQLVHDFVCLAMHECQKGHNPIPRPNQGNYVTVTWRFPNQRPARVPWVGPVFDTFWELDRFVLGWDSVVEDYDRKRLNLELKSPLTDVLGLNWIAAACASLLPSANAKASRNVRRLDADLLCKPDEKDGERGIQTKLLRTELSEIVKTEFVSYLKQPGVRGWRVSGWLCNLAVLLAPESGLPNHLAEPFIEAFGGKDSELFQRNAFRIRRIRAWLTKSAWNPQRSEQGIELVTSLVNPNKFAQDVNTLLARIERELMPVPADYPVPPPAVLARVEHQTVPPPNSTPNSEISVARVEQVLNRVRQSNLDPTLTSVWIRQLTEIQQCLPYWEYSKDHPINKNKDLCPEASDVPRSARQEGLWSVAII